METTIEKSEDYTALDIDGENYYLSSNYLLLTKNEEYSMEEFIEELENNKLDIVENGSVSNDGYLVTAKSKFLGTTVEPIITPTIKKATRVYEKSDKKVTINQLIAKASEKYTQDEVFAYIESLGGSVSERSLLKRRMYFISPQNLDLDIVQLKKKMDNSNYFEYVEYDLMYFTYKE